MSTPGDDRGAPRSAPCLDALVHPVPLAAVMMLLWNDHVFKITNPGWLSGKLSDIAGLIVVPFVLLAAWDLMRLARPGLPAAGLRLAVASVAVVVLAFATVEVMPLGSDIYRMALAGTQWPFRALTAFVTSEPLPGLAPVQVTSDLSDLLALPAALIVLAVRPWSGQRTREARGAARARFASRLGRYSRGS